MQPLDQLELSDYMKNQYSKIHLISYTKKKKKIINLTCKFGNKQRFGGIDVKGPGVAPLIPLTLIDMIFAN